MRIEHVRSHTDVPGNELADQLADEGMRAERGDPELPYGLPLARRLMDRIEQKGLQPDRDISP